VKTIRVLLVDDHEMVRAGIRTLLEGDFHFEVVAEASNGREAVERVAEFKPDVVLMDISLPEMNGLEAAAKIQEDFPRVRVIILSVNDAKPYVLKALHAGAAGYLLKNVSRAELRNAIDTVVGGEIFLSSTISKHVVSGLLQKSEADDPLAKLSPRQREVLQLLAEGFKSKEIAKKLTISVKTVEMHRGQLMKALDIHDVPGLVRFAIRMGLISA
jgi:DNA-binding NarL/FixJ family response regulator